MERALSRCSLHDVYGEHTSIRCKEHKWRTLFKCSLHVA